MSVVQDISRTGTQSRILHPTLIADVLGKQCQDETAGGPIHSDEGRNRQTRELYATNQMFYMKKRLRIFGKDFLAVGSCNSALLTCIS